MTCKRLALCNADLLCAEGGVCFESDEQEGGMFGAEQKVVFVSGVLCYSGNDNTVTVKTLENVGNILIINNDEASRWRWFCAINAGLHRIAAAKVMLDQPSAIVPWHDKAIVEQELES